MSLMQIDPGVIIWTLIIFTLLLVVLGRFAWKPILQMLRQREQRIRESLERAEQVQAESEHALAAQKALLDEQRTEMAEALRRNREEAERVNQQLLEKARREAAETVERARRQIEEERKRAIESVRVEAVELALGAASHLLARSLDSTSHRQIVREFIKQLPASLKRN